MENHEGDRMSDLLSRVAKLEEHSQHMENDVLEIKKDVKAIRSRTDKWSGVFGLVMIGVPALLSGALVWLFKK